MPLVGVGGRPKKDGNPTPGSGVRSDPHKRTAVAIAARVAGIGHDRGSGRESGADSH